MTLNLTDPDLLAAVAATREGVQDHLRNQAQLLGALRELLSPDTDAEVFVLLKAIERRGLLALVADRQTVKVSPPDWNLDDGHPNRPQLVRDSMEVVE